MRKVVVRLVLSPEFIIFANANFGDGGLCTLRSMLHDRLTSFDLAKSGKFTSGVKTSLVKLVLYLLQRARTAYYICDTGYSRTLLGRCREVGRVLLLLCLEVINLKHYTTMPLFRITVKSRVNTNGIRLEPGMSVDVVSQSFSDPVHTNGGQSVADAFMRIYGVDIKKAGALNGVYLKVDRIG